MSTMAGSGNKFQTWSYLQLMRPPNLVTAAADILAGFAVAGLQNPLALPALLLSTICIYGGGVVLNDVFDADLDAVERPERPIPSGRVPLSNAALFGAALILAGVAIAFLSSLVSGLIALLISACAVLYDGWGKHYHLGGPLNMGLCRGLNLMLGVSAVPAVVLERSYLVFIPMAYIAAITAVSRGEVRGGKRTTAALALSLLLLVITGLLLLGLTEGFNLIALIPLLAIFSWRVVPAFWRTLIEPKPEKIRAAVKAGVLSLIILDAAIAAGFAGLPFGLLVLALIFVAGRLARIFAVT
jgi:4-hydroxybenzoate polyprenyltransferase